MNAHIIFRSIFVFTLFFIIVAAMQGGEGTRAIIYVDDDAPPGWYDYTHVATIQEGIDHAASGDQKARTRAPPSLTAGMREMSFIFRPAESA